MAHEGIFATSDEIIKKAGHGASSTYTAEAVVNDFIAQAESEINVVTRRNWSDDYSGLNTDVKRILSKCAASLAAIEIITCDMGGYTSRTEAESMINVLRDTALRLMSVLKTQNAERFMDSET
jgi:hypothetical protein|tara:strand:- start:53 stop:421 length:369 start_codon:yes stop_codon:yes gene_type:complete